MDHEDNRNEDIPNELPDNRKTKGGSWKQSVYEVDF